MTLEETADLALRQAQRAKDYTDILNVFSAHLYCYRAQKQSYEMEHYWARRRDDLVYANAQGRKAVMDFYCGHNAVMRAEKRKIASAYYPEISDTDSFDGVGDMVAKAAASPYIMIAEDGLSAHGIWFVPGFCCELGKDGAIQANYFQEKNAVDLVKEDDGWKILRLNILVDFQTPCPHIRFSPEQYRFHYPAAAPNAYSAPYAATTVAHFCPPLPEPYETWEEHRAFASAYEGGGQ